MNESCVYTNEGPKVAPITSGFFVTSLQTHSLMDGNNAVKWKPVADDRPKHDVVCTPQSPSAASRR